MYHYISSFQCSRSSPINQPKDNFRIIFRNTAIPTIPLTSYFFLTFWKGKLFKRRDRGIFNIRHLSWAVHYPTLCISKLRVSSLNKWAFLLHQYITLCHRSIANPFERKLISVWCIHETGSGRFSRITGTKLYKTSIVISFGISSRHARLGFKLKCSAWCLWKRQNLNKNKSKEKVLRHPDSHQKKIFLTSQKQNSRNPKKDE